MRDRKCYNMCLNSHFKITYDNLTLSEVIEKLFLPHAQNDCKIAVSSSSQSLIEFIYFILAICDSPC